MVVMRAVRLPAAVVPVVKMPADGCSLETPGSGELVFPAVRAAWREAGRFGAAATLRFVVDVVDKGGGIVMETKWNSWGRWGILQHHSSPKVCQPALMSLWGLLSGRVRVPAWPLQRNLEVVSPTRARFNGPSLGGGKGDEA